MHWERAEGYCAHRLARVLIELNRFEEAQYWLDQASSMADHWKEPLLQAYVLLCRGYLLRNQQRLGDAHTVALAALDLLRRLASRELHDAAALVAQLEEALDL